MTRARLVGRSSAAPVRAPPPNLTPRRRTRQPIAVGLWLPLTPILILLAPLPLLAAPFVALAPAGRRLRPLRAAWVLGTLLLSLSGTLISVDTRAIRIRIRIF